MNHPELENNFKPPLSEFLKIHKWYPAVPHSDEYAWINYEKYAVVRYPFFNFSSPTPEEIKTIFKKSGAAVLSYSLPCPETEANTWWYVCRKFDPANMKFTFAKSVKRGLKSFTVREITAEELIRCGFQAYSETRKRIGLTDYNISDFKKKYSPAVMNASNYLLGAFSGAHLAACHVVNIFNNYVEGAGVLSCNDALKDCPNDILIYTLFDEFLNKRKYSLVSYGFSSIQEKKENDGLHKFKIKCGFEAVPVKRVFVVNPKYKLFINPATENVLSMADKLFPGNRMLRKALGILRNIQP